MYNYSLAHHNWAQPALIAVLAPNTVTSVFNYLDSTGGKDRRPQHSSIANLGQHLNCTLPFLGVIILPTLCSGCLPVPLCNTSAHRYFGIHLLTGYKSVIEIVWCKLQILSFLDLYAHFGLWLIRTEAFLSCSVLQALSFLYIQRLEWCYYKNCYRSTLQKVMLHVIVITILLWYSSNSVKSCTFMHIWAFSIRVITFSEYGHSDRCYHPPVCCT